VDDLVHAVGSALRTPGADGRIFNLAMRSPPTWNEYFERFGMALGAVPIARISRRRLWIETALLAPPLKALQIAARPLPRLRALIAAPMPPSFARLCAQHITLDVSRAERVLGMTWTPLDQGLRATASAILRAAGRSRA
jgi:nucleoside-diphosphate-sugar epimerase